MEQLFNGKRFAEVTQRSGVGSMSQIGDEFLAFGHGRHACPGRYMATAVVKLMLVHFVRQYDFEPLDERPPVNSLGNFLAPSFKLKIKVRSKNSNRQLDDV